MGENDNPLYPFVSVASNMHSVGTTLKIRELENKVMPGTGGQKHNGCVRVDDESWSFDQGQLDFFTGRYPYYQDLDKLDLNYVNFEKATCTPVKFNVQKAPSAAEFSDEFEIEFIDEP